MFFKKGKKDRDEIKLVLLRSTQDHYELSTIKTILEKEKIPYILKDHGSGGHMRVIAYFSVYPTDILVESSTFEKADELLKSLNI